LDIRTCARCVLHGHGLNRPASLAVGSLPTGVGRILGGVGASGGMWTALRMTELVELRHAAFHKLMAEVDHVVALCHWVKELLLLNGVAPEKISISRQGLCQVWSQPSQQTQPFAPLRVAFLGRLDATKGPHVLIEALRGIPQAPMHLDIYGVVQGEAGASYLRHLKRLATNDPRITFHAPIPAGEVIARLREYDLLAVPSQWLETGPMVVLEAFAAGIPVVGSNLGGIAELVEHEVSGLLVDPHSSEAWGLALETLSNDRVILANLRAGIRPPRSIRESAAEMQRVYAEILARSLIEPASLMS